MKTMNLVFAFFLAISAFGKSEAQNAVFASGIETFENKTGGEKTESGAEVISNLQEGLAITRLNGKFGLVNTQGIEILYPRFDEIRPFHNGYAAAKKHGRWGFLNKQGRKISEFRYDWVGNFENGFAPIQKNGKWGFINEQGIEISDIQFEAVRTFKNAVAQVQYKGIWFIMNEKGEISFPDKAKQA